MKIFKASGIVLILHEGNNRDGKILLKYFSKDLYNNSFVLCRLAYV